MVNCWVFGCKSRSERKEANVTFHRFPSDVGRRNAWTKSMHMQDWMPRANDRVCSIHFEEKCFYRLGSKVRLLDEAVPTIFPTYPSYYNQRINQKRRRTTPDPLSLTSTSSDESDISLTAPHRIRLTPTMAKLKRQLLRYRLASQEKSKKIKALNQSLKRCKEELIYLKTVLRTLQNKNSSAEENIILIVS